MSWSECVFHGLPGRLPGVPVPDGFVTILKPKRTPLGSRWMMRNEVKEQTVRKGAWNLFLFTTIGALAAVGLLILIFGAGAAIYGLVPSLLAPILSASLYLNAPETFAQAEERRMLREGPSTIGCISMSMQVRPSLEQAVAFASERGEGVLSQRLKEALWSNLTRTKGSLNEAIDDLSSSLAESNASLRQAFHLVVSATCERTKEGMDRLLDKANAVALTGVRDAVESYVASLSLPTMVLFSLGTLLPIMLFSILPLLSLGTSLGGEAATAIPFPYLAFLLLVVLPAAALLYSWNILSRNPLGLMQGGDDLRGLISPPFILVWVTIVALVGLIDLGELKAYVLSGAIVLTPCAYLAWRLRDQTTVRRRMEALERGATNALFQIGNRMLSGATFEKALQDVSANLSDKEFSEVAQTLLYQARLSGRGFDEVLIEEGSLKAASPDIENAYVTVVLCAKRDPQYAGQIALNLAQMLADLRACQGKVEDRLRGVVDMMRSTGMVFAPIVLGVTGALFALIGAKAAMAGSMASDIGLVTGIYIGELSFLVSFFTVLIMGERSWKGVAYCYATRTPVAFVVFVIVSFICRTGLTALL
jgi:hypothetical protein